MKIWCLLDNEIRILNVFSTVDDIHTWRISKLSSVKVIYCSYNCETKIAGASVNSSTVGMTAVINIWKTGLAQRTLEAKIPLHQSFSNYFWRDNVIGFDGYMGM
jgi:hypothetical protein